MKRSNHKILFLFNLSFLIFPLFVHSQNITGIWRGYFVTQNGEQYRYEIQINQTKASQIEGVTYSYLDTRFYGKALISGSFVKKAQTALIQEIKTVEVKMASGSTSCIMKCMFTYARSGKEEFLEGTFTSAYEKSDPYYGVQRGGNCGGGKVFLRKVTTSDFYVEPFLKNKIPNNILDSVQNKPEKKKPALKNQKSVVKTEPKNSTSHKVHINSTSSSKNIEHGKKHILTHKLKSDTVNLQRTTTSVLLPDMHIQKPTFHVPEVTRSRKNELVQTIIVNHPEINIRLYDNGEIDDDTLSVYMDGKPLIMNQRLSTVPIKLTVKLDDDNNEHTLQMYAENMGRIPPNTSLMIVQDGDKRYEINLTSTEKTNAMIRFRYEKPKE